MSFVTTIDEQDAAGDVAAMYERDRRDHGYVRNYTRAFSLRPAAYSAWRRLAGAVATGPGADPRRYELATLGAATALRSSYCALAHGQILADRYLPAEVVVDLVDGTDTAATDEVDRATVALARKVAADATRVDRADIQRLRDLGLDDGEILDVILAAAARCFFSTVLDATGALPDAAFQDLEPDALREALTVGRPISDR